MDKVQEMTLYVENTPELSEQLSMIYESIKNTKKVRKSSYYLGLGAKVDSPNCYHSNGYQYGYIINIETHTDRLMYELVRFLSKKSLANVYKRV